MIRYTYRGYTLHVYSNRVEIHAGVATTPDKTEYIDVVDTEQEAKDLVDYWHSAA